MSDEPQEVTVRMPEDRAAGDYANGLALGVNAHELVLDFLIDVPAPGQPPAVEVVRRIRIPIAIAGELLRGVGGALDGYEATFGAVHVPQPGRQSDPGANP